MSPRIPRAFTIALPPTTLARFGIVDDALTKPCPMRLLGAQNRELRSLSSTFQFSFKFFFVVSSDIEQCPLGHHWERSFCFEQNKKCVTRKFWEITRGQFSTLLWGSLACVWNGEESRLMKTVNTITWLLKFETTDCLQRPRHENWRFSNVLLQHPKNNKSLFARLCCELCF